MATSKKTPAGAKSRSRSTTSKAAGAARKTNTQAASRASNDSKQQLAAILLFALGILFIALTMIKGVKLWLTLHNTLFAFFGIGSLFVGIVLIYIAILLTMGRPWKARSILCGLTLLGFCGALQIFQMGMPDATHVLDSLVECVQQGIAGKSGGILGIPLGLPLLHFFGKLGAGIIIVLFLLVMLMLLSGATLVSMARTAKKPVKAVRSAYEEEKAYREQRAAEKQQQKAWGVQQTKSAPPAPIPPTAPTTAPKSAAKGKPPVQAVPAPKKPAIQLVEMHSRAIDVPLDGEVRPEVAAPPADAVIKTNGLVTTIASAVTAAEGVKPPVPAPPPVIDISLDDAFAPSQAGGFSIGSAAMPAPLMETNGGSESQKMVTEVDPDLDALVRKALAQGESGDLFTIPEESAVQAPAQKESALKLPPLLGDDEDIQSIMAQDPFFQKKAGTPATSDNLEKLESAVEGCVQLQDNTRTFGAEPSHHSTGEGDTHDFGQTADFAQSDNAAWEQASAQVAALELSEAQETAWEAPKRVYQKPPLSLLNPTPPKKDVDTEEMKSTAQLLVDTLASFGVQTRIVDIARGPAVTRYELQPSAGVKISRITGLADDIALNLASSGVRIEAPIPNKAAVGIEVPNKNVSPVHFREIVENPQFLEAKSKLTVALGRDIAGQVVLGDIASMPHVLIAGSTGSGKSVCINSIIMSLLFQATPEEVRFLMVDPKVVELGVYNGIPHLLVPVVTEPKKAAGALSWAVTEMLKRYKLFADTSVRDLKTYNALAARTEGMEKLPQVVIIIDELADLMMAAPNEIEDYICRLTQMARAAGMHLIIATQRPSVDVITGLIKSNIPSRIAFAVSSAIDSRTILDTGGAEKLLGKGDMLFNPVGLSKPRRVQGCFVTDDEIERVISFIKDDSTADYNESIVEQIDSHVLATKGNKGGSKEAANAAEGGEDEMLMAAVECVVEQGAASTSFIQRRLKVGYARAGRLMDQMEAMGIVGPYDGAKPRQVLIGHQRLQEMKNTRSQ